MNESFKNDVPLIKSQRRCSDREKMASRGTKREADEEKDKDTVCGYIHNVTECRISLYKRVKLFNAVIQTDRDEFRNMAIFAAEKHTTFKQAEKNKSPVKLSNVSKQVSKWAV